MNYHFSNGGNDTTGDGSILNPFQTVAKANALIAAFSTSPFSGLFFFGGQTFNDAALNISGIAATAAAPVFIDSYGTGRAKISWTSTSATAITITGCTNIHLRNISPISVVGTAAVGQRAVAILNSSNINLLNLDTLGGEASVYIAASTTTCRNLKLKHAQAAGIHAIANTQTLDNVEIYGAGYTAAFVLSGLGYGLVADTASSAVFIGKDVRIIKSAAGINAASGGTTRIRRLYLNASTVSNPTTSYLNIAANSTLELYDSIARFTATAGTPYVGFFVSSGAFKTYNTTLHADHAACILGLVSVSQTIIGQNTSYVHTDGAGIMMYIQSLSTRQFTNCRFHATAATPFLYETFPVPNYTMAQWLAEPAVSHTNSTSGDPGYENIVRLGPEFAKLSPTSNMIGAGADLSALYSANGFPLQDYFGFPRYTGLWSIGAAEVDIPTLQSFSEGGSQAALDGGLNILCLASLRELPAFGNFPAVDHQISAKVRFETGMTRVGIWALGGRVGASSASPSIPINSRVYQHTFSAGSAVALEDGDRWDIGETPGLDDPRRVIFEIVKVGGTFEVSMSASVTGVQATGFSTTTSNAAALLGLMTNKDLLLTLKVRYLGRIAGPNGRNDYRFSFIGEVDGQIAIAMPNAVIPQGWIEGFEIDDADGISGWAGIIGLRSASSLVAWRSFDGLITGAVTSITVPAASAGEVRPKNYLAPRHLVPNRIRNGSFTSFPKTPTIHTFEAVIESIDPMFEEPSGELPTHVILLVDASSSMDGGNLVRCRTIMNNFVLSLPTNEIVILTVVRNWGETLADTFIPTQVIRDANRATIAATVSLMTTFHDSAWPAGVALSTQEFIAGVDDPILGPVVGARKIMFAISDESAYLVNAASTAIKNALHAIEGMSEVSVISVEDHATSLATNFAAILFPAGIPANTPRDPALSADPAIPSSVTIPDTTGCISLSTASLKRPSLTATQGLNGNAAATQIGVDMAAEVQKWVSDYFATFVPPEPPPTVRRNAYESWVPFDASYAFDVVEGTDNSALGPWVVTGVRTSIEIKPKDSAGLVIPSKDGGNAARITLGRKGSVDIRQAIADVKPFRDNYLTAAFSGQKVSGNMRVSLIIVEDGVEKVADVSYSSFYGNYSRRVAAAQPIKSTTRTLEVILRISGAMHDSLIISGISAALGRYDISLPYSEAPEDHILPSGAVIMYTGSSCPPGFRSVPGMSGRNAFAFTGDPYFYQRKFVSSESGQDPHEGPLAEVVVLVDLSSTQSTTYSRTVVLAWLNEMISRTFPKNGTVSVSIITTNKAYPGFVLVGPTTLTTLTESAILQSIANIADPSQPPNFAPPSGDKLFDGFTAALPLLQNSTAPVKMLFYNTDSSFSHSAGPFLSIFSEITAVENLIEVSAAVINSTRSAVLAVGGENLIYPSPSSAPPGILFEVTGGSPGFAIPGAYTNQPYAAGAYAAEVFARRVRQQIAAIQSLDDVTFSGPESTNLGGHLEHDHANGAVIGSSIDEPDGFEPVVGDGVTTTVVPLPTRDTAVIKPYRFHVLPSLVRPEDPPVYAVGPGHSHQLPTKMSAKPPSFSILFCEKL